MEELQTAIAFIALIIAAASFIIAQHSAARAKKADAIKELLGKKETVAFAALKLLRDGLPRNDQERAVVLAAVMQACVFEGSDRSRALLYRVLDENTAMYSKEISTAFKSIKRTFNSMDKFEFTKEQLDLKRGRRRLTAVEKVLYNPTMQPTGSTDGCWANRYDYAESWK